MQWYLRYIGIVRLWGDYRLTWINRDQNNGSNLSNQLNCVLHILFQFNLKHYHIEFDCGSRSNCAGKPLAKTQLWNGFAKFETYLLYRKFFTEKFLSWAAWSVVCAGATCLETEFDNFHYFSNLPPQNITNEFILRVN